MTTRCGFIAVLGAPNAGKSTLINQLVGQKVSIVSSRPNLTRHQIYGIFGTDEYQVILVDTPGLLAKPRGLLQHYMLKTAWKSGRHSDLCLVLIDVKRPQNALNQKILQDLMHKEKPVFLIFNKIDQIDKEKLLPLAASYQGFPNIQKTFMISGLREKGIQDLKSALINYLPEGELVFPPDALTQISLQFMAAETTREKIFECLYQEVPYQIHVVTDHFYQPGQTENVPLGFKIPEQGLSVFQTIFVQKTSHRKMIIGEKGQMLKRIGTRARLQMQEQFEEKVHLFLHVKIDPEWAEKTEFFKSLES
jgi:GTPase